MNDPISIATGALAAFAQSQTVTANNLANVNTPNYSASSTVMSATQEGGVTTQVRQGSDRVDISREATTMLANSDGFKANLKVLTTAEEMSKDLLNIKA